MRVYICCYHVCDEPTMCFEYYSSHRNGSKANLQDAIEHAGKHMCKYYRDHIVIDQTYLK